MGGDGGLGGAERAGCCERAGCIAAAGPHDCAGCTGATVGAIAGAMAGARAAGAIAGARAQHDYEVISTANALLIDGDAAYALIKKLNKGLYGVVKGFVSRAMADDSLPNRLS